MDYNKTQIKLEVYDINGGLDQKFEPVFPFSLKDIVTPDDFKGLVTNLNAALKKHRCKKKDLASLALGAAFPPMLMPFMVNTYTHLNVPRQTYTPTHTYTHTPTHTYTHLHTHQFAILYKNALRTPQ